MAYFVSMPFFLVDLLIDIDDIEILVHPEFVHVIADKHGPMLGWIRITVNLLGDHFTQSSLLGEPFASQSTDGMPANLDPAQIAVDVGFARWDDVWLLSQADGVLQHRFGLNKLVMASVQALFSVDLVGKHEYMRWSGYLQEHLELVRTRRLRANILGPFF